MNSSMQKIIFQVIRNNDNCLLTLIWKSMMQFTLTAKWACRITYYSISRAQKFYNWHRVFHKHKSLFGIFSLVQVKFVNDLISGNPSAVLNAVVFRCSEKNTDRKTTTSVRLTALWMPAPSRLESNFGLF